MPFTFGWRRKKEEISIQMTVSNISFYIRKQNLMLFGFDIGWAEDQEKVDVKRCILSKQWKFLRAADLNAALKRRKRKRKCMQNGEC